MTSTEILAIKMAVRRRDGFRCVECGMTNKEHLKLHGAILQVHRVSPGSEYSDTPGVCVTLCHACHGPKPKQKPGTVEKVHYGVPCRMLNVEIETALYQQMDTCRKAKRWTKRVFIEEALRRFIQAECALPPNHPDD